jgi:hypothetical protein
MPPSELAHLELLAEVDSLVERLGRWAGEVGGWQPAEKCRALVRRLTERAGSLRIRCEAPLVVATLGGTGTGKSALVNAIVGAEVVQTGRARPTTVRPTLVCRPDLTPEMLGIDPATVEVIARDLPALRDLVLVDCPDPDTTEDGATDVDAARAAADSNLARLRAILPKCDVLLVTATQQKYRSARVADELAAAASGAHLVFVQTHADFDADIRDDWRRTTDPERCPSHIFLIDSLAALADAQAGRQPRGELAQLIDLLTRRMAGAAANRIRRANFLDLAADTLAACGARIDEAMPAVRQLELAVEEQRGVLAREMAGRLHDELTVNRRQWENRLLGCAIAHWGLSPFSLVLRIYQGVGGLASGALLYRARTPAQIALWGALEGARSWRKHRQAREADRGLDRATALAALPELRKASIIVEGYVAEAGLPRGSEAGLAAFRQTTKEAESIAAPFVARVGADLDALVERLAKRHTGWWTRMRYELMLLAMLGLLLYRLGRNFFYDSWFVEPPRPMFGLEFYVSAGFWLLLWCLILVWAYCSRLRSGLRGQLDHIAAGWQDPSTMSGLFLGVEEHCLRAERFLQDMETLRREVERLRQSVAVSGQDT